MLQWLDKTKMKKIYFLLLAVSLTAYTNVFFSQLFGGTIISTDCYAGGTFFCSGGPTAIIEVINPTTGAIWMDRNMGAAQVATSPTDAAAYGDLYQWGRGSDGHQCRTSSTTGILSSVDQPTNGNFILTSNAPYDWRSPQNNNLWQGVNGINNPCPCNFRLPTSAELTTERLSWISNNASGAFSSPLKITRNGYRANNGALINTGAGGDYYSSTINGTNVLYLAFDGGTAYANGVSYRSFGRAVRCIKN